MSDTLGEGADTVIEHAQADALAGLGKARGDEADDGLCRNCGAELAGEYCHACGQSARNLRRPFFTLVKESVETLFAVDGRLAQTLPVLMLQPGRMSREYLDGRRARFIPPFRLYVFASLIFFVLLPLAMGQGAGFTGPQGGIGGARQQVEQAFERGEMSADEYQDALEGLGIVEGVMSGQFPGAASRRDASDDAEDRDVAGLPPETQEALRRAGQATSENWSSFSFDQGNMNRLGAETRRWVPRIMFALLPVFAALLAVVYLWRRGFFYFDHLIVSLHFHAALFLAMSIGMLAAMVIGWGWVTLGLLLYANAYLYKMNRVVYGRGRFGSAMRVMLLDFLYFIFLMIGLLVAFALGAASLG